MMDDISDSQLDATQDATQDSTQATQPILDPRRRGEQHSGFSDETLADIICILIPYTAAAREVVANAPPEFVMGQNDTRQIHMDFGNDDEHTYALPATNTSEQHLAFRFSSKLKQPLEGFVFGRNIATCDVTVDQELKSVSNKHFKIYFNEHGILMIEDMSLIGTGSVIEIYSSHAKKIDAERRREDIQFLVRVPNRHGRHAEAYNENLIRYLQRTEVEEVDVNKTIVPGPGGRVDIFRDSPQKPRAPVIVTRQLSPSFMFGYGGVRTWKGSDKYNFVGKIGQGAFATVYMIADRMNGRLYAAKELEKRRFMKNGVLDQKVENEMKIMQTVSHKNIVQFKEHLNPDDKHLYIIMEFVAQGDLAKYIGAEGFLSEPDTKEIATQLVDALAYLHAMNITHRDVKPDNILMQSRDPLVVKLTDFGLSKMIDDHEATFLRTFCGTLLYCAPEVYAEFDEYDVFGRRQRRPSYPRPPRRNPRYDHKVDIWSLGGVLYFALTTQPPFPATNGVSHTEFLHQVMTTVPNFDPLMDGNERETVSPKCIDFLSQMLRRRPENRAKAKDLLKHEWLCTSDVALSCSQDGGVDEQLEAGASQLSLRDESAATPREDAEGDVTVPSDGDWLQEELIDDEGHVNDFEHDKVNYVHRPATQTERFFGEVGQSALGSQGVVAPERLNLPTTPTMPTNVETPKRFRSKMEIPDSQANSDDEEEETPKQSYPNMQGSQPLLAGLRSSVSSHASRSADAVNDVNLGGNSQSLEGAESRMGLLDMKSRHVTPSTDSTRSKRKSSFATNTNSRSSIENEPVSKKRRSNRRISSILNRKEAPIENEDELLAEMPRVQSHTLQPQGKSIYWHNEDSSTAHLNYPEMTIAQWKAFETAAENRSKKYGKKEKFTPGETPLWALAEKYFPPMSKIQAEQPSLWELAKEMGIVTDISQPIMGPLQNGGDLQSLNESILPGISVKLSKSIVTWGRSPENTESYPDEPRIPECALKIMVWRENFNPSKHLRPWVPHFGDHMDLYFYVATKAPDGIFVNGKHLASNEPKNRNSICKNWMRLYNGDRIIVHVDPDDDGTLDDKIELIFNCNYGGSSVSRQDASEHHKTPELVSTETANKLDTACVKAEKNSEKCRPFLEMYPLDTADCEEREARLEWEVKLSENFQKQIRKAQRAMSLTGSYSSSSGSSSGSRRSPQMSWIGGRI
ncbi:hypothetical protein SMACR_04266 [Sordaria macrospora]|uniref:Autophagy-related protein 1 n=1 Tax=Sordaria macrospora TaxID=5147 RepID=A0A8S8ZUB1_SORMA|nr:hypothetical protein SMACR_04266 [Sordaria macrospora]WPJ58016.1 hypothetical protein SMAC4_04266 [Sordaria macrospora]